MRALSPLNQSVEKVSQANSLQPFSPLVFSFLKALSQRLLRHPKSRGFPEITALGFWLRDSQLRNMQSALPDNRGVTYQSLGMVAHYTPANVDTMFIYSWVCSLLLGNRNIVRLSSRYSETKDVLLTELNYLFERSEYLPIAETNLFVSFAHDDPVSEVISRLADARVIWGGDETVINIKKLACKPRCRDIAFADRYSVAVVNTELLQSEGDFQELASKLWRDTEPYAQMACSSPKLIWAVGNSSRQAMQKLGHYLSVHQRELEQDLTQANNHLVTTQLLQSHEHSCQVLHQDGVTILHIENVTQQLLDWHCGQGMFYVMMFNDISDVTETVEDKLQTLSYWGWEKEVLFKILLSEPITGIDRIVPVGQALDFSHYWDGYELLTQLSKTIITK